MASAGGAKSPAKAPPKLPAVIANASLEELQKLCVDTLKKLRARDKRIEELNCAAAVAAPAPVDAATGGDSAKLDDLRQQVHVAVLLQHGSQGCTPDSCMQTYKLLKAACPSHSAMLDLGLANFR